MALHLPERFMQLQTPQVYTVDKFRQMASSRQHVHPSELSLVKGAPLNIRIGGTEFPVLWSIIGASLFVAVVGLFSRRRY
jgi:hypothetical protein